MKTVAMVLCVIGAINWGLIGIFDFDLVARIFGDMSAVTRIIYVLVALSGIYLAVAGGKKAEAAK